MKRSLAATLFAVLTVLLIPLAASASPIKAFVKDFSVSSPAQAELKNTLKTLLVSRLKGGGMETVESEPEAEVVISGSLTALGKIFSLDAVASSASGKEIATAYEQGEYPDAVIPAVGKIAAALKGQIAQGYQEKKAAAPAPAAKIAPAATPAAAEAAPAVIPAPSREVVMSKRIPGAQTSVAAAGADLLVTAKGASIRLYRRIPELKLLAETEVPGRMKIIALDSLAQADGSSLVFVSIVDGDAAASRVYRADGGSIKLLKENLPYLFRAVAAYGGATRLYAQQLGQEAEYYGDVYEATFAQGEVKLSNPVKMPHFANIFNFNLFRDPTTGESLLAAFSDGGYLIVYSHKGEELWRSEDRLGGSETFFTRKDQENERFFGTAIQPRFINQRITVTPRGEVIVPKNGGLLVLGNSRSYSKYTIAAFAWNGASLEERWTTEERQGYLADYFMNPAGRELVLLEVTQKEGIFGKGASAIRAITAP